MITPSENTTHETFWKRGGGWVVTQMFLLVGVGFGPWVSRVNTRSSCPLCLILGGVLLILGAGIGILGAVALRRALTPFPVPLRNTRLVSHGIYSKVRHPLYSSILFGAAGWAIAWQSIWAFVFFLALIPFFIAKARCEERFLMEKFPDYAEYARHTRRFLPWFGSGKPE